MREGKLDVVVNNAGFTLAGGVEEIDIEEEKAQMMANFFWCIQNNSDSPAPHAQTKEWKDHQCELSCRPHRGTFYGLLCSIEIYPGGFERIFNAGGEKFRYSGLSS